MTDYVTFEGRIIPMGWGTYTYTVLPIPAEVLAALGKTRRVEGEINDHPVNMALTKAPVIEDTFVWTGKALMSEIGVEPGTPLEVRLRPADDAAVEVPGDVRSALHAAGRMAAWSALTPGKQRAALHQITSAKRAETCARRIAALLSGLTPA